MAGKGPSVASNKQLPGSPKTTVRAVLGITGRLDEWMSCRLCGCGALAHGYNEPSQRCICGKCTGYRTRLASRNERSDGS